MTDEQKIEIQVNIDPAQERDKSRLIALLFIDFTNNTPERKINLLGVFDRLTLPSGAKKSTPVGFFLKLAYVFEADIVVTIFAPNNMPTGGFVISGNVAQNEKNTNTQMQLVGQVQFDTPEAGHYWVDVSYQGQSLGGARLVIEFLKEEEEADGSTGRSDT